MKLKPRLSFLQVCAGSLALVLAAQGAPDQTRRRAAAQSASKRTGVAASPLKKYVPKQVGRFILTATDVGDDKLGPVAHAWSSVGATAYSRHLYQQLIGRESDSLLEGIVIFTVVSFPTAAEADLTVAALAGVLQGQGYSVERKDGGAGARAGRGERLVFATKRDGGGSAAFWSRGAVLLHAQTPANGDDALEFARGFPRAVSRPAPVTWNAALLHGVSVALPRGMKNATPDPVIIKESSAVVIIPKTGELYAGAKFYGGVGRLSIGGLGGKIGEALEYKTPEERIVYLMGGAGVDYGSIVEVLKALGRLGVEQVGLVAETENAYPPSRFRVLLPAGGEPVKPGPPNLVLNLTAEGRLKLEARDVGGVSDTGRLRSRLGEIRREREAEASRRGDSQVEGVVLVKAPRGARYGDVVRVIDAVEGAGWRVGLLIDDLQ
jgi:biopolymer transport protein ExbD